MDVSEYGCWQGSYNGTSQTAPSEPHHGFVEIPVMSVSSKNGVINTPPFFAQ
jgi:hypothetical protein